MMNTTEMARKMEEMLKGGKSLEEALRAVTPTTQPRITDRIAWIKSLSNITELKTAIKIAFAKKSKAKDNEDTRKRYEAEVKAGQERLNELMKQVNEAPARWAKSLELGDSRESAAQLYIEDRESEVNLLLESKAKDLSKAELKRLLSVIPVKRLEGFEKSLEQAIFDRLDHGDQRVATLIKKILWVKAKEVK